MITVKDLEIYFRPMKNEKEKARAEMLIPTVYDMVKQEALNVGGNIENMIAEGRLLETVLDEAVMSSLSNYLVQPTDSAASSNDDGYQVVYAPAIRITNRVLERLGILRQEIYT